MPEEDSRPTRASSSHGQTTLTISCVGQACPNVVFGEVRILLEDLLVRHPGGQKVKNVINRNAQTTDARLAATFARLNSDY
jgi:hypothetical protein